MGLWTTRSGSFQHEALLYAAQDELIRHVADFVADGLVRGEPAVVALSESKLGPLREALGGYQVGVRFLDMDAVGTNPGCLIPAYREVVDELAGDGPCRAVGEPVAPHRQGPELVECQIHETVSNLAFADSQWWAICPYDTNHLGSAVIDEARRSHPSIVAQGSRQANPSYDEATAARRSLEHPLAPRPGLSVRLAYESSAEATSATFRELIGDTVGSKLSPDRARQLALAAERLVADSALLGTDGGVAYMWATDDAVVTELQLPYGVTDPLVGRERADTASQASRGIRAANQSCDLVQVRSDGMRTTVRLHMRLP
jgi:hypothetical protein